MNSSSPSPLRHIAHRLLWVFTAALTGYIWGWIWGWSLFDPNLDIWALAAALFSLVGLGFGLLGRFQAYAASWLAATGGLFAGWYARVLIFGDHPGGWGILLLLAGTAAGWWLAHQMAWGQSEQAARILLVAFYSGFFGGFVIDVVLLDLVWGVVKTHSIQSQALWVAACACLGGWLALRQARASSHRRSHLAS